MAIISIEDFSKATGICKFPIPGLASLLMRVLKIGELNGIIERADTLKGAAFADHLLKNLGISIQIDPKDLLNIPSTGAFIAIANHPYGAIESLALLQILTQNRPDAMFMGNFLLKKIPNLAEYIIPVNPFENVQDASSISGLKATLKSLKDGVPVAIFPAGEVSSFEIKKQKITDRQWHPVVGKIISKANVPVVPIYFHGNNGMFFSLLKSIHPSLQTAKLISELFNKKGHVLRMRIGKPVYLDQIPCRADNGMLLDYLREKTYALGAA